MTRKPSPDEQARQNAAAIVKELRALEDESAATGDVADEQARRNAHAIAKKLRALEAETDATGDAVLAEMLGGAAAEFEQLAKESEDRDR